MTVLTIYGYLFYAQCIGYDEQRERESDRVNYYWNYRIKGCILQLVVIRTCYFIVELCGQ